MSRLNITITADEILQSTNGGRDIFERELGKIGKKCINSPLRNDKNPSFSIFLSNNGLWMYKDFSNGDSGTAIKFLQLRYNLDYKGVLNYIKNNNFVLQPIQQTTVVKKEEKKELIVDWVEMPFSDRHKQYFDQYELDEPFLKTRDIYALKKIAINKRVISIPDYQYKFAYYASDIDKIKVLTLGEGVTKQEKWRSFSIENKYIWDYWRYKECNNLFVVKSNKDAACIAKLGRCAVSLQSEDAKVFLENNVEKILAISKNPIILMGADQQGFDTSYAITQATGWKWFNTKKKYLQKYNINDPASLVEVYNMKKLEKELLEKGL